MTLIIKTLCVPIYIIRFKNYKLKQILQNSIEKLSLDKEQKKTLKKSRNYLNEYIGLKSKKLMFFLFIIELILLILLINKIRTVKPINILWFNLQRNDILLSIFYILILIINELTYIKNTDDKHKKFQYIFSFLAVILLGYISFSIKASILIYLIVSVTFNIFINICLEKLISSNYFICNIIILESLLISLLEHDRKELRYVSSCKK